MIVYLQFLIGCTQDLSSAQWHLRCLFHCVFQYPVRICCPWRMPSANPKLEKQASTEAVDPIRQAVIVIEHKIRNLEKRKVISSCLFESCVFAKIRLFYYLSSAASTRIRHLSVNHVLEHCNSRQIYWFYSIFFIVLCTFQ